MYTIAIPSYKRSDIIQSHTLNLLIKGGIDPKLINIFVANQSEYNIYTNAIPKSNFNKIIIGKKGIKNQRNFITNYFPNGINLLSLDDDILDIEKLSTNANLTKLKKLDAFFNNAFDTMKKNGSRLWGVYPVRNAFFMKSSTTNDLRFIVGTIFGKVNDHSIKLTIDEKDDFEQTIKYYIKDKSITRFNNITINTKYYSTKGGLNSEGTSNKERLLERQAAHKISAEYLHKKYPTLTKIYDKKKSGFVEVRLIKSST